MKYRNYNILVCLCCLLYSFIPCQAKQTVKIDMKLDSVNLLMGNITTLHLSVTRPINDKGDFPLLSQLKKDGIVSICGDSVELRKPSKIDTVSNGSMLTIKYDIPLQSFDSGYYQLPQFEYITDHDTLFSNSLGLKVYPVVAEATTPISDYASFAEPADSSIFDWIPDFIIDLWWLWIIILLALALSIYVILRYRKKGYFIPPKPEPSPYEVAMSALKTLKSKKLWENGLEKEYFTELTEILRLYLYKQFGINAMEMTSRQILASLKADEKLKDKQQYFRQIVNMADFVKFAKVRPLPDDNVLSYDNAVRFVEETRPLLTPEDDSQKGFQNDRKGGDK